MAKLYFRYGAMNSGKSTALIQVAHNYEERGMRVSLVKPAIDTKGDSSVVSRIGVERKVDILLHERELLSEKIDKEVDCIIIDECQFLKKEQVDDLITIITSYNIPIICYGLRTNFQGELFEGSSRLLALADSIEELKTICRCGKKATMNIRFINGKRVKKGKTVAIDNNSKISYEAVCHGCFIERTLLDEQPPKRK